MFVKSALNSLFEVLNKGWHFGQLGKLHVRVPFGVVGTLAVHSMVRTPFFSRIVREIFAIEQRIVSIRSRPLVPILGYTPLSDVLAVLQSDSNPETSTNY